jgi:hypothetical protein
VGVLLFPFVRPLRPQRTLSIQSFNGTLAGCATISAVEAHRERTP